MNRLLLTAYLVVAGIITCSGFATNNSEAFFSHVSLLAVAQVTDAQNEYVKTSAFSNLSAAKAAIGSGRKILYIDARIAANSLTIPATTTIEFSPDGLIDVAAGHTVTINGTLNASHVQQIFSGAGIVTFGYKTDLYLPWYGAVPEVNTIDNRETIQRCFKSVNKQAGATIKILGKYRLADYVWIDANNLTIEGGGELYFDTTSFTRRHHYLYYSGLVILKDGAQIAKAKAPTHIDAGNGISGEINEHLIIRDITLSSNGHIIYEPWNNWDFPASNIPLRNTALHIWCYKDVLIDNVHIRNFFTDAVEPWGCVDLRMTNCLIENIGFNGFGGLNTDGVLIANNRFKSVWQPMETSGLRTVITGNIITDCFNKGIWVSVSDSFPTNVETIIANNTISREFADRALAAGSGVTVDAAAGVKNNPHGLSVVIEGNSISGTFGYGVYNLVSAPYGNYIVQNNVVRLTSAVAGNDGISIQVPPGYTDTNCSSVVRNNNLSFSTAAYNTAISVALNNPSVIIEGNVIKSPGFRSSAAPIYHYNVDESKQAIRDNYLNGKRMGYDSFLDTSTTSKVFTAGKPLVRLNPGAPRTVNGLDGYIGQTVTLQAVNNSTTFVSSPFLTLADGGKHTLKTGKCITFFIYSGNDAEGYYATELSRN